MTLEVKIPYRTTIFQALVLACWRFQGIGMVELLKATLSALQERLVKEMQREYPGKGILVSINRLENIWSQIVLRIKRIGKRWSVYGARRMLGACLVYALHPERFVKLERTIRGEHLPVVTILITSLTTEWVNNVPPVL